MTIDVVEAVFFPKGNVDRPPQPQNKATMTTAAGVAGGSISSSSVSTARRKPQQQATIHHKYNKGRNYHHSSSNANSNDNSNNNSNYNSDVDYSTATSSVTAKGGNDRGRGGGGFISRLGLGSFRSLSRGNSNHAGDHTDTTATLNPILDGLGAEGEDDSDGHHAPVPSPLRRKVKPVPSPTMR